MSVTATPVFIQTPKNSKVQILNATGTAAVTIATGGANGTKVVGLIVTSTDTANRNVAWGITTGGTFFPLGTVQIPLGAGTSVGVPAVNLFSATTTPGLPIDGDGNPFIFLTSASDTLVTNATTTITAATQINFTAILGDF